MLLLAVSSLTFEGFEDTDYENLSAMLRQLAAKGYSGYMSAELSPEIGEDGNAAPFTDDDRRKPLEMFKGMEQRRTGE